MTQLKLAKDGIISPEMKIVAENEQVDEEWLRREIAKGHIVIPKNINHDFQPMAIGNGTRTKINANLGTSPDHFNLEEELQKFTVNAEQSDDITMLVFKYFKNSHDEK